MKTLIPLALLLLFLSSYKTYNALECKNQNKITATEFKDKNSFSWIAKTKQEFLLDQKMYDNNELSIKLCENFTVEIDGTAVSIKGLYKKRGLQLLPKKQSQAVYIGKH